MHEGRTKECVGIIFTLFLFTVDYNIFIGKNTIIFIPSLKMNASLASTMKSPIFYESSFSLLASLPNNICD